MAADSDGANNEKAVHSEDQAEQLLGTDNDEDAVPDDDEDVVPDNDEDAMPNNDEDAVPDDNEDQDLLAVEGNPARLRELFAAKVCT